MSEEELGHDGLTSEERIAQILQPAQDDWYNHQILIVNKRNAELEARAQQLEADLKDRTIQQLRSYDHWGFHGDVDDPIYIEAMRIENMGFEQAHKLRPCGHSRGDYRDPKYGTPQYAGDEQCVACVEITALRGEVERLRNRLFCNCPEPYLGAQLVGTLIRCERCTKEVGDTGPSLRAENSALKEKVAALEKENEGLKDKWSSRWSDAS